MSQRERESEYEKRRRAVKMEMRVLLISWRVQAPIVCLASVSFCVSVMPIATGRRLLTVKCTLGN